MIELISAMVFNERQSLKRLERIQGKIKHAGIMEKWNKENKKELEQKIKEASSVMVILDDLVAETENLILKSNASSLQESTDHEN